MEPIELSQKEWNVLTAIQQLTQARGGVPPTLRELARHLGYRSWTPVRYHVKRLEELGVITQLPGTTRTFRVNPVRVTLVGEGEDPDATPDDV